MYSVAYTIQMAMESLGLSSLFPRMSSLSHHERLSLSPPFLGSRVGAGQPNSTILGVQFEKFDIPRKRCVTTKQFSVNSILADVAKDFMVTFTSAFLFWSTAISFKLEFSFLWAHSLYIRILLCHYFGIMRFVVIMTLQCRVTRHQY